MNVITETENFYGYLIGLHVQPGARPGSDSPGMEKLYATFERNHEISCWEVPDLDLFRILAKHLCDMAWSRSEIGEYGYEKLWIKKEHGRWHVDLP